MLIMTSQKKIDSSHVTQSCDLWLTQSDTTGVTHPYGCYMYNVYGINSAVFYSLTLSWDK